MKYVVVWNDRVFGPFKSISEAEAWANANKGGSANWYVVPLEKP